MLIGGFQKSTLIDYPRKIATTIFTSGCNFNCPFCHNPELVDAKQIKEHPIIEEEVFFNFLKFTKRSFRWSLYNWWRTNYSARFN